MSLTVAHTESTRRQLRAGMLLLAVLGLGSLGLGFSVPSLAPDVPPVPVPLSMPVTLPKAGPFGGTVALYGAPTEGWAPADDLSGCRLESGSGRATELELSERRADDLDRRVLSGRALVPLLKIQDASSDWTITCAGPGAIGAQPLYLVTTSGHRDLIPMAAFSFATLAIAVGIAGTVTYRPNTT